MVIPLETTGPMAISFGQLSGAQTLHKLVVSFQITLYCFEILRVRKQTVRYKNAYDKIKFVKR